MILPKGRTVVPLRCNGGVLAWIVDSRWVVHRCRHSKTCSVDGERAYHVWDLETGRVLTTATNPLERGTPAQGVSPNGIR